jgi:hypothetical protein
MNISSEGIPGTFNIIRCHDSDAICLGWAAFGFSCQAMTQ